MISVETFSDEESSDVWVMSSCVVEDTLSASVEVRSTDVDVGSFDVEVSVPRDVTSTDV